ncbi:MAG: TIGR04283 family arsenosugar biosynthesis glycosyltransferase [Janthinobacterium lividum]
MTVSIIIPTFNEAENIGRLVHYLRENGDENLVEIIVSDGSSIDKTVVVARDAGAKAVRSLEKGRAWQMNFGASMATGELLYFVHADTVPPKSYLKDIVETMQQGYKMGRYLSCYDSKSWLLKINALLSRINTFAGMGGDQTLFITRELFEETGGFDDEMKIMEEFEFSARARKRAKYKIIQKAVLISARKYDTNGWLKVQKANYTIVRMYKNGASQEDMVSKYKQMLNRY